MHAFVHSHVHVRVHGRVCVQYLPSYWLLHMTYRNNYCFFSVFKTFLSTRARVRAWIRALSRVHKSAWMHVRTSETNTYLYFTVLTRFGCYKWSNVLQNAQKCKNLFRNLPPPPFYPLFRGQNTSETNTYLYFTVLTRFGCYKWSNVLQNAQKCKNLFRNLPPPPFYPLFRGQNQKSNFFHALSQICE